MARIDKSRREFLSGLGCAFLTRAAILAGAERLMMMNAFAKPNGLDASSYRALVCVFLFGGNDANNMVIPLDGDARAAYDTYRPLSGIGIQPDELNNTVITPPSDGRSFGLHPRLGDTFTGTDGIEHSSLYGLWAQDTPKVAIVTNVGTLIRPTTRDEYRQNLPGTHPYQLFSHSDQQNEWQTSYANFPFATGWAGRTADYFGIDPSGFPTIASVAGVTVFSAGRSTRPIVLPDAGTQLSNALKLKRADDTQDGSALRDLLNQGINDDGSPTLVRDDAAISMQAILNSLELQQDLEVTTQFPNTGLGRQLHQVARLIKLAQNLSIQRQIFFCSIGGFDTHNNQGRLMGGQANLLSQVSQALGSFYDATVELGVSSQVTTFTESDFSRTFVTGGSAGGTGTDHAWGSHHFVVGDAVIGGDFYGTYPNLVLGDLDDTDGGGTPRGRWIPTTGVDQYAATLAAWFGVAASDIPTVFPNIGHFNAQDLGFMNSGAGAARRARALRKA